VPEESRGAALLPLRWGRIPDRVASGAALILSGGIAIAGSSVPVLWLAGLGILATVAGWSIMPAAGWRRIVAAAAATPTTLLVLTGTHFLGALVVPFAAWLLVRHRPARAWITVLFPAVAAGIVAAKLPETGAMLSALGIMVAVIVGSAWLAALLSRPGAAAR
jgi:hypothetical protein